MVLATCILALPGKLKGVGGPLWNYEYAVGHLESLQEAESATRLAPPPSTLSPCFLGYATVNHNHPNAHPCFYKSLWRAF